MLARSLASVNVAEIQEMNADAETENNNVWPETKNDDKMPPLVLKLKDENIATGGSPPTQKSSDMSINRFRSAGLPQIQDAGSASRDETYDEPDEESKSKKYPSLVINAALRWYERDLKRGGIMLFDWIRGQFQVFEAMQTFRHQRTFLALHHKNVKRLFSGMLYMLQVMKIAGIAHNNISLETIMLLSAPSRGRTEKGDLFSFIDSPPWYLLLTSFGCASLAENCNKRTPSPNEEQFHSLIKDNWHVQITDDRTFRRVTTALRSFCGNHTNYSRYDAPEKEPVAPNGDLWTLGVLLWECLTNTFLWQRPNSKLYRFMVKDIGGFRTWFKSHVKNPGNAYLPYFVPNEAIDLLDKIFRSENKRISCNEALRHKFFSGVQGNPAKTSVDLVALGLKIRVLAG